MQTDDVFGVGLRYIGDTFADAQNTIRVPDYVLTDASIRYTYGNWRFQIAANNLFDRVYVGTCALLAGYNGCNYGDGRRITGSVTTRWKMSSQARSAQAPGLHEPIRRARGWRAKGERFMATKIALIKAALALVLPLAIIGTRSARAESPAQTGTGGGALSTTTAPNTSSVGRTKPPGSTAGPEMSGEQERRTPQQKKDSEITSGICNGCN